MRLLARVGSPQAAITALTGITALYMSFVAFGNITDYDTNHAFVQHVFAMDTTFGSPNTTWRAITNPTLVTIAYLMIIAWETVTALVLLAGLVAWLRGREETARRLSSTGWVMQVLLFGGGFIAIGGEWFVMWQSKDWNGLSAAFQNFVIAALCLVLLHGTKSRAVHPSESATPER
jgi:predicted small integral membrane protein